MNIEQFKEVKKKTGNRHQTVVIRLAEDIIPSTDTTDSVNYMVGRIGNVDETIVQFLPCHPDNIFNIILEKNRPPRMIIGDELIEVQGVGVIYWGDNGKSI